MRIGAVSRFYLSEGMFLSSSALARTVRIWKLKRSVLVFFVFRVCAPAKLTQPQTVKPSLDQHVFESLARKCRPIMHDCVQELVVQLSVVSLS